MFFMWGTHKNIQMSAYYDLLEKPDIRQTGEQQPLYARFIPKGTIERKEFLNRVHLLPASVAACWRVRWRPLWTSCATALLMAGQWNLANLAISPLR